ncbi:LacI family DNA-binding transcriptional regulator [Paenibacillus puerhi]|uniref:LacI family DNA-binding transcriptional regulator n=1 Tax=Paenibacillus puerhi TaxID=2692622 RepID=UPI00135AC16C|nr:LacI family DNA-binding transcriptional regulator [Paenibacillus puerhi]
MKTKKVSMQLIADQLGVSKFAVSQALSGKSGVSEETRAKIIQTASALGYRGTHLLPANKLVKQNNEFDTSSKGDRNTVIILMPNVRFQDSKTGFWGKIIGGVSSELEKLGTRMMMLTEHNAEGLTKIINPDAILGLIGIGYIARPLLLEIRNSEIPIVLVDHEDPLVPCDSVLMNNYDSLRMLTTHLYTMGHTRMRFVGPPAYSRSFHDRWLGFRMILEENGLQLPPAEDPFIANDEDAGEWLEKHVDLMIARGELPTVFVCANDFFANLMIRILEQRNLKVPEHISVTGFDNAAEIGDFPQLTTVNVPNQLMGVRAIEMLRQRLEHPDRPFEKVLISGDILLRQSVRKI